MDMNRFTEKAQEALTSAQQVALRLGHQQVEVEHLLASLLGQEPGLAVSILQKANVNVSDLRQRIKEELDKLPRVTQVAGSADQIYVGGRLQRLLAKAEEEAKRLKDEYVSVEHLLLAMTGDAGTAGRLLKEFGVTRDAADDGPARKCAAISASPRRTRRPPTRPWRSTAAT